MSNNNLLIQTKDFEIAKSSLMFLASNEKKLKKKMKKHGSLPIYLRFLIKRYRMNLKDDLKLKFRNTKRYQAQGLNYYRIKFEIDGNTWMAYQLLAFYHRLSISYLFALLLSWDVENDRLAGESNKKKVVTVLPKQIQLNIGLFLDSYYDYDYECILELKT